MTYGIKEKKTEEFTDSSEVIIENIKTYEDYIKKYGHNDYIVGRIKALKELLVPKETMVYREMDQ